MLILGIESSCDDTSVALVEAKKDRFIVLSEKTASQVDIHKKYGGVVPEIAGRQHAEKILPIIEKVLEKQKKPDVIAVTAGPGLITGLLVGVEAAKTLSYLWNVPLVRVNHISGHAHSVEIRSARWRTKSEIRNKIEFPALCLIVSGGHTELLLMKTHTEFELIGKTRDDAAGETFDKVGKLLGFAYPGGAKISKTAEGGNTKAIKFPRPMIREGYEFSFAGLKTSALYWLRDNKLKRDPSTSFHFAQDDEGLDLRHFCASFEQAIVDVLVTKTIRAAKQYKPKSIILAGGVSANQKLREQLKNKLNTIGCKLLSPNLKYAMDNAAMIAVAGYYQALKKDFTLWDKIEADPNWKVYPVK